MAINLPQGFNFGTQEPADQRLLLTKAQMKAALKGSMPQKYFCVCKDDGKIYIYNSENEIDPEIGRFRLALSDELDEKQDKLTAGKNITIKNNVISSTGGGGEPDEYIKSASVLGNTLTLVNKDDTTVEFTPQGGGTGAVNSVNGKTGNVILNYEDVGALSEDTELFSGDYNDLINKPEIPSLDGYATEEFVENEISSLDDTLSDVAKSGSYNDLSDKPTIPVIPTNVSAFNNDAGYLTEHQDISGKQDKLTAGTGIIIDENNNISVDDVNIATVEYVDANITDTMNYVIQEDRAENAGRVAGDALLQAAIDKKQNQLTAGSNITIEQVENDLVISADDNSVWAVSEGLNSVITKGNNNQAKGESSVAEGAETDAHAFASHAEGYMTSTGTNADYSHVEGYKTSTQGQASHAEGDNTITNNAAEHAEGRYNKSNMGGTAATNTLHSIGIGNASGSIPGGERKNAFEVMQNGDIYILGIGSYNGTNYNEAETLKAVIDTKADIEYVDSELDNKQDKLVAGANITISEENVISANTSDKLTSDLITNVTVGGIQAGTTFIQGTTLETILRQLLYVTPVLQSIYVDTPPTKTSYSKGDTFNPAGMIIKAKYSAGGDKVITDYTYSPTTPLTTDINEITISYTEDGITKQVTQQITVIGDSVTIYKGGSGSENDQEDPTEEDISHMESQQIENPETNLVGEHIFTIVAGDDEKGNQYATIALPKIYKVTNIESEDGTFSYTVATVVGTGEYNLFYASDSMTDTRTMGAKYKFTIAVEV